MQHISFDFYYISMHPYPKAPLLVLSNLYISVLKSACVSREILVLFDLKLFTGPCCAMTRLLKQVEQFNFKATIVSPRGRIALFRMCNVQLQVTPMLLAMY